MKILIAVSLSFIMLMQGDMPDFQMHSAPINAPAPGNLEGYMIGAFGAACTTLFSLVLWLLRVIFREKEKALEREVERYNRRREENNSSDTSMKEVLQNINFTMGSLKDVITDLKKTDEKALEKIAQVEGKVLDKIAQVEGKVNEVISKVSK